MPVHRHPVALSKITDPLAIVPLDMALVGRLRLTYERVRAHDLRLAELFYPKLFAAAPHLRSMFQSDPDAQVRKLTASLDAVVQNFENPAANTAILTALGQRHAGYGAKPEHYTLVIDLLLASMREVLGAQADDRDLDDWRMALRLISNQMIAAGQPKS